MRHRSQRNWSKYNNKLKKIARIDFYISEDAIKEWNYAGKRKPGGKKIYSDHVIELCSMMKEFYKLPYRQTEGFISSIFDLMGIKERVPDYTTLSRRISKLNIKISTIKKAVIAKSNEGLVVAVDSTGLSTYSETEWLRKKHKKKLPGYKKWRKLHVAIDVESGAILDAKYTKSTASDGPELKGILDSIDGDISAVCGDMAYDTVNCRKLIYERGARQLIPPIRGARLSQNNRNIRQHKEILKERDDAINYIKHNTIDGDQSAARASWKKKVGYHARSLVETTMHQIKSHCTDRLTNKLECARTNQALIKCKLINRIINA